MTSIDISICPTELERGSEGDWLDPQAVLERLREFCLEAIPDARFTCLQVPHRQLAGWAYVGGDSEAGKDLMERFWRENADYDDWYVDRSFDNSTEDT